MSGSGRNEQFWQPSTFVERGVAVPFTTPILAGARARSAVRGAELIVPHPAGARGVYVLACAEVAQFCAATLHDLLLAERIAGLPHISPSSIRAASRAIAAGGAAGHAAQEAAAQAGSTDKAAQLAASMGLLQSLARWSAGGAVPAAELDKRVKAAVMALAAGLGLPPARLTADIEAVARHYPPLGVSAAASARLARLADAVGDTVTQVRQIRGVMTGRSEVAASLVVEGGGATLALACAALEAAWALAADPPALMAAWQAGPAAVEAKLGRAEWVLDGWQQICLVWKATGDTHPRSALGEMALMVPVLPAEANTWAGEAKDETERARLRRAVLGFEDWRIGGLVLDLVARNEKLLAMAA